MYALYDFGSELLPIFSKSLTGTYDAIQIFTVGSSLFLGAPALLWIGIRFVTLRSFSYAFLYYAVLPIVVWLERVYAIGPLGGFNVVLSFGFVYVCIYIPIVVMMRFVHTHWFTPISHESDRYVSLEKPSTSFLMEFKWAILSVVFVIFVIFNPIDALHVLRVSIDGLIYAWNWLQQ